MTYRKSYSMTDVGVNIRRVRRERGISVEQLREHLMLESTQSVYRWERGETMPQADTLIALCVFLDVDPLTLFNEHINPTVQPCVYFGRSYKKEIEQKSA